MGSYQSKQFIKAVNTKASTSKDNQLHNIESRGSSNIVNKILIILPNFKPSKKEG